MQKTNVTSFATSPMGRAALWGQCLPKLPARARLVFVTLATYAHEDGSGIFPSFETLARRVGMSRRTIGRALAELTASGVLIGDGWKQHCPGVRTRQRRINLALLLGQESATDGTDPSATIGMDPSANSGTQTVDLTVEGKEERKEVRPESRAARPRDACEVPMKVKPPLSVQEEERKMRNWCRREGLDADAVWQEVIDRWDEQGCDPRAVPLGQARASFYAMARGMLGGFGDRVRHPDIVADLYGEEAA